MDNKQEAPRDSGGKSVKLGFYFFIGANIVMALIVIYRVFFSK
jgi:hypothetical protein